MDSRNKAGVAPDPSAGGASLSPIMPLEIYGNRAVVYIALTGLGLGSAMSTSNLAVQNSVPFRLVGSATSAIQFARLFRG